MPFTRSHVLASCLSLAGAGALAVAGGCSAPAAPTAAEPVGAADQPLDAAQCLSFDVGGKDTICHYTGSGSHPYTIVKTSDQGCIHGHSGHAQDYIAVGDPTCQGGGCLPTGAPCDATLPCCTGSCVSGACVDPCSPNPCENGGTCAADGASYTCACPAGFTGTHCETPVSACGPGEIHEPSAQPGCPPGFAGPPQCDIVVDDCESNPCSFGDCIQDAPTCYHCDCSPGWGGDFCDTPQ
jgi:hypothetical protein